MFIDQVKIHVKAGDGGKGCNSLYRDMYTRHGIPDGGDGGNGADIIIKSDRNIQTLLDLHYNKSFRGQKGANGSSKGKRGGNAPVIIVKVPIGTIVTDRKISCVLRDLDKDAEEFIVARGGKGGLGNKFNKEATGGRPGEEKDLLLDLKLIADVGVIGFPNVGKSTLICSISNAHSKIASYHFTTKSPVLGVVRTKSNFFVAADIPGLIEGSSHGKGLGDKFLRHIERTKILIHLIDMSGSETRDPVDDYHNINKELKEYSPLVFKKTQIIVANKMDLDGANANLERFKQALHKKVLPISALKRQGLEELIEYVAEKLPKNCGQGGKQYPLSG